MSYPCTKCGACCRHVRESILGALEGEELFFDALDFPYAWDETGCCSQLLPDNTCAVYETRPRICRVEEMCTATGITIDQNIDVCNMLMDWDNMPQHFRILKE